MVNREHFLAEIIRVVRPGGWIVVTDSDWATLMVDASDESGLTSKILNHIAAHAAANRWQGRESYRLLKQAQLSGVTVKCSTAILTDFSIALRVMFLQSAIEELMAKGELTSVEATGWLEDLREADQAGQFFGALTFFSVAGQKPGA